MATDTVLFEESARAVAARLESSTRHGISTQGTANILWTYAKVSFRCGPLLSQLSQHAASFSGELTPQSIANIVWTYGTLSILSFKSNEALKMSINELNAVLSASLDRISEFSTQNLANIL